ncbi:MAG TPA: cell division protein FtsK [Chitinophagaceae bacterium]|nr:cell division protein FtsK [Chitinophagaceae bacterium]
MANKLKSKTPPPPNPEEIKPEQEETVTVEEVVKDERTHKIAGAVCLLLAAFFFIAFASYCGTWEDDQDKVHQLGVSIFATDDVKVSNLLGVLGAYVAHQLMFNGFGVASFLFCSVFFVLGVNMLFDRKVFSLLRNLKYVLIGLPLLSVASAFFTTDWQFSLGGAVGEMLEAWLVKWLGKVGTGFLLVLAVFSYIIWRFNPTFKWPTFERSPFENDSLETTPQGETPFTARDTTPVITETPTEELPLQYEEKPEAPAIAGNKPKGNIQPLTNVPAAPETTPADPLTQFDIIEKEPPPATNDANQDIPLTVNNGAIVNTALEILEAHLATPEVPEVAIPLELNTQEAELMPTPSVEPLVVETPEEAVLEPIAAEEEVPKRNVAVIMPEQAATTITKTVAPAVSDFELEIKATPETAAEPITPQKVAQLPNYEPTLDLRDYKYPNTDLLETHGSEKIVTDQGELEEYKNQIIATLKNYDIAIQRISATVGPTVTLYEIVPAPGVRISRIKNLEDDIALSLSALGIRIIAPIPGKGTIGIEVPNVRKSVVSMRTLLSSDKFANNSFSLPIAIGKRIDNENFIVDLATMPHLLMAGATGQGKSVGLNAILVSLLYKKHPSQLKFVLVDPKKVELSLYRAIENHFLAKLPGEEEAIITDTKKVINTLNALCIEMDNRYDLLKDAGCRNIKEYNEKFVKRRLNPEKGHQFLPFIVLVVDEFADLIMTAGKEVEMPIARLAQLARAVGIHLIIATQRPSVNIITGTIKANFPARIAFKVSSKIDSRTILDAGGAEQLIGKGDMLVSYNGEITRLQCAFVDTPEVERICEFIGYQNGYPGAFLLPEYVDEKDASSDKDFDLDDKDPLFEDAAKLIVQNQVGSTSLIQRRMKLGYNRAGRLMDQLEAAGIVGGNQGSKPREVLVKTESELQEILDTMF